MIGVGVRSENRQFGFAHEMEGSDDLSEQAWAQCGVPCGERSWGLFGRWEWTTAWFLEQEQIPVQISRVFSISPTGRVGEEGGQNPSAISH